MNPRTLALLDTLGRGLMWAAVAVLGLSLIGAFAILTSDNAVFLDESIQEQGRGILAVGAFASGLTAGGVLAGLGALVRLEVARQRARARK